MWPTATCSAQRPLTTNTAHTNARSAALLVKRPAKSHVPIAEMTAVPTISALMAIGSGAKRSKSSQGETTVDPLSGPAHVG